MFGDKTLTIEKIMLRAMGSLILLMTAYFAILMEPHSYRVQLLEEINESSSLLNEARGNYLVNVATNLYFEAFVDTGFVRYIELATLSRDIELEEWWITHVTRIVENTKLLLFQASYRLLYFLYWGVFFVPCLIPLLADGYYKRRIKQYEFGVASTGMTQIWRKIFSITILLLYLYFIFPSTGQFVVYIPMTVFLIIGIAGHHLLSNYAKVF